MLNLNSHPYPGYLVHSFGLKYGSGLNAPGLAPIRLRSLFALLNRRSLGVSLQVSYLRSQQVRQA